MRLQIGAANICKFCAWQLAIKIAIADSQPSQYLYLWLGFWSQSDM